MLRQRSILVLTGSYKLRHPRTVTHATILFRSHTAPELTLERIRMWSVLNPKTHIVLYDASAHGLGIKDDAKYNLTLFPTPRPQRYGYPQIFDAYRWIAEQFPGAFCHYTEYDSVPVRAGYLDQLAVCPDTVLAGESDWGVTRFREFHEEWRYRAVEVVSKILDVPMKITFGFAPSLIYGADCLKYLGQFEAPDFEQHIFPALDRIRRNNVFDEIIVMSLLAGRGFRRVFNPAAKFICFEECDERRFKDALQDDLAFAVHAIKTDQRWARDVSQENADRAEVKSR